MSFSTCFFHIVVLLILNIFKILTYVYSFTVYLNLQIVLKMRIMYVTSMT